MKKKVWTYLKQHAPSTFFFGLGFYWLLFGSEWVMKIFIGGPQFALAFLNLKSEFRSIKQTAIREQQRIIQEREQTAREFRAKFWEMY